MKIMTLNINLYSAKHGPWEARKKLICEMIRKEGPEIVALQAVQKKDSPEEEDHQAGEIARECGDYDGILFHGVKQDGLGTAGQAFLSRLPFRSAAQHPLSRHPDNTEDAYQRFVYGAALESPLGALNLFNCHFSWIDAQNEQNIRETISFVRGFPDAQNLMMGDFNAEPDKRALELLRKEGWIDLWAHFCPEEAGNTFEADSPSLRIDYAWASPNLLSRMRGIRLLKNEISERNTRMSDHLGLVVEMQA